MNAHVRQNECAIALAVPQNAEFACLLSRRCLEKWQNECTCREMSRRALEVMCSGKKLGKGAQYYAMM
jgi:hypothetical protein